MNRLFYRILSGSFGERLELRILLRQTARAFGVDTPKPKNRSASALLKTYAQFTADAAGRAIDSGQDLEGLHQRLYHMSCRLGSLLRRWLRLKDDRECLAVIAMLYRNIGIRISEASPGTITVHKCYFSTFYTPEVCSVISAIDQGIFAGIYQRGRLTFSKRITEGYRTCRARLFRANGE